MRIHRPRMKIEPNKIKELANVEPVDPPVAQVPAIRVWGIALVALVAAGIALG